MKLVKCAIFISIVAGVAAASEPRKPPNVFCELSSIPLSSRGGLGNTGESSASVFAVGSESSSASIDFTNRSASPANHVALIVEYLDASDRVALRVPFYATYKKAELPALSFPFPRPQSLTKPIRTGETVSLEGDSAIIPGDCPTHGRVIFEHVWFADGSEHDSSNSIDLDPDLNVVPSFFDSKGCRIPASLDTLVRLQISESGVPQITAFTTSSGDTASVLSCLKSELKLWSFTPAVRNGVSVASDLNVLFRFHSDASIPSDTAVLHQREQVSTGLIVVHFARQRGYDDRWDILYGGGCCGKIIRSRELYHTRPDEQASHPRTR